jgi:hypothetical protein
MKIATLPLFLLLSLSALAQPSTSHGYALRLSSMPIPKEAMVVNLEIFVRNGGAVVVHDLPSGWSVWSGLYAERESHTRIGVYPFRFERIAAPTPLPLTALDHTVLIRKPYDDGDSAAPQPKVEIHGRVDYFLPGDKLSRSYEFSDRDVSLAYGDD